MIRRLIFPALLGLAGVAVLLWLCLWQVQRLDWKRDLLENIQARLATSPAPLPLTATEAADEYLPVTFAGRATGDEIHVLSSGTSGGTGYLVISAFETAEGRRILLDQGILPLGQEAAPAFTDATEVQGNLLWPDDKTASTPAPDLGRNIWFARDVAAMAEALGTEPLLVVLRSASQYDPRLTPVPVDTSGIKNDHREYAITWALLAVVWAAMTGYWMSRIVRRKED
jgi:surfeit locus 1 family protein